MNLPQVVGVLRGNDPQRALELARAAIRGGLMALEVTSTVPDANKIITTLRLENRDCLIAAGTVLNSTQAADAIAAGACFLVSPHLGLDVLEVANASNVPYIPGVLTPTEVIAALAAGCETLKIFPIARAGGEAYLRDLHGPFPQLKVLVTGGVKLAEVGAYLRAGAVSVGLGDLFTGEPHEVQTRTQTLLEHL